MQRQGSFSQAEYSGKKKQTQCDKFLGEMEQVVPWARLVDRLRPFYPKGERGRRSRPELLGSRGNPTPISAAAEKSFAGQPNDEKRRCSSVAQAGPMRRRRTPNANA